MNFIESQMHMRTRLIITFPIIRQQKLLVTLDIIILSLQYTMSHLACCQGHTTLFCVIVFFLLLAHVVMLYDTIKIELFKKKIV